MIAFRFQEIALGWQILETTDSALWLGIVSFAYGLPMLLLSPVGGLLADRWRRQNVVMASQTTAAVASGILALLALNDQVTPYAITAVSFVLGCTFALFSPSRLALLPNLVPPRQLENAIAMEYASTRLVGFFGPIIAGFLLAALGVGPVLLVQMALFLSAAVIFKFTGVDVGKPKRNQYGGFLRGLGDTWSFLRTSPSVLAILLLGLFVVPFGMTYGRLMQVFVREILELGPAVLGLALGLAGLGSAVSGLIITMVPHIEHRGRLVVLSAVGFGIGLIFLSLTRQALWTFVTMLSIGLISGVYLALSNIMLQTESPDWMRGRVISVWGMIWGLVPMTVLVAAAIAEEYNVALVIGACGLICALGCSAVALTRREILQA